MATVASVGSIILSMDITAVNSQTVIAVPVYTIMRNSDVPAQGGMNNTVVACEGEFGGESES